MYSRSQPLSFQPFNLLRTLKNSLPNQFQFPRSGILSKFRPDSTLKRKAMPISPFRWAAPWSDHHFEAVGLKT